MFQKTPIRTTILFQIVLTVIAGFFVFPLVLLVSISLRGDAWGNYLAVLELPQFPRFFLNSAIISVSTILVVGASSLLGAYAFSKLKIRFRSFLFYLVLMGLMVPGVSLMVPLFVTIRNLGLLNTYGSVIGPLSALTVPFTLLISKNFFDDVPNQLLEAAAIDGCDSFQAFLYIMLPLSKSIVTVLVIWSFLTSWNEYLFPLLFLRRESMQVLTQAPQFFMTQYFSEESKIFAALVLIAMPVILLYLSLQRRFEQGMTAGSLK